MSKVDAKKIREIEEVVKRDREEIEKNFANLTSDKEVMYAFVSGLDDTIISFFDRGVENWPDVTKFFDERIVALDLKNETAEKHLVYQYQEIKRMVVEGTATIKKDGHVVNIIDFLLITRNFIAIVAGIEPKTEDDFKKEAVVP